MFNPSRDQARQFFLEAWRKHRAREIVSPLESLAADLVALHPEYHALLDDLEETLRRSRGALQALEAAADPVAGTRNYLDFIDDVLGRRRHGLEHLFRAHYTIDDWRASSFVDADSILEERERFAAARGAFPPGALPGGEASR